jgi:hypothetical protein
MNDKSAISFKALILKASDPELFRTKVAEQLVKDFEMCSLLIAFDNQEAETIMEELRLSIASLINRDSKRLVQLLYRVDLNEQILTRMIEQSSEEDISVPLSLMILEREAKKVLLREQFGGDS